MSETWCRTKGDHGGEYRVVSGAYACSDCVKRLPDYLKLRATVCEMACCYCGRVEVCTRMQGHPEPLP